MTNRTRAAIVLLICTQGIVPAGCGYRDLAAPMPTAPSRLPPTGSPPPSAGVTGEYTLTVTADSSCIDLPTDARTRAYEATVTPNVSWHDPTNTHFDVWASGPFLDAFKSSDRIVMVVAGDRVTFSLSNFRGQPALVEPLSATSYVAFGGAATASAAPSAASIAAVFGGFIDYCVMKSATELPVEGFLYDCSTDRALTRTRCESSNHRLSLTRR
jgi:hypothetical protein